MSSIIEANRGVLILYALGILSAMLLTLLGAIADNFIFGVLLSQSISGFGYLVLFLVFSAALFFVVRAIAKRADKVLGAEVRAYRSPSQVQVPFILMGYSPLTKCSVDELTDELKASDMGFEKVAASVAQYNTHLSNAARTAPNSNVWQQNLRSLWHHRDTVHTVVVLDPDTDQFEALKCYIECAFDSAGLAKPRIMRVSDPETPAQPFTLIDGSGAPQPRSYENYNYVYEGFSRALQMLRQDPDCRAVVQKAIEQGRIKGQLDAAFDMMTVIDATPGQKSFSIAAAVLTLNRPLRFSYVTTFGKERLTDGTERILGGELRFYDTNLRIAGTPVL